MISVVLLHGKTLVLLDEKNRRLIYLPIIPHTDDHYALMEYEIMSYLYENTIHFDRVELISFEE